ncbi:MAG: Gfo/Idh/MocA family oxidoreductase [Candidatus Sumerlaeia bacterium]|nr:Gfo/Idh/MocA family oxidoreductase [Candidatus Sumerlaeia bacterium]
MTRSIGRRSFIRMGAGATLAAAVAQRAPAASNEPLRVAFIGVGGRGTTDLNQAMNAANIEVVAICDITPENLKRALDMVEKKTGKRPEGIGDYPYAYRQLLTRKDIDAVVIATPCYWHEVMYADALAAGKPFYGEKPLAITAKGVKALQEAAKSNPKVVVQIGFQWGAHPSRRDIIGKVRQGLIGELLDGRFRRLNGWDSHGNWYTRRAESGDWMLEQAVHEFNLMWMVTQAHPKTCVAVGRSGIIPGRDTTNYYTAILEYEGPLKNLVLHYSHGWIEVPGFKKNTFEAEFVGTRGAVDIMAATATLREKDASGKTQVAGEGGEGDTAEHFANFFECVRNGTPEKAYCGIANGVGATMIGLIIRTSLEQKRPVTLDEALADTRTVPVPPV